MMLKVIQAVSEEHTAQFRGLVIRYAEEMGFDLRHPKLVRELEHLPGDYSPPGGLILLASVREGPAGCAALKRLDGESCEIRRLYVVPDKRGAGTARELMLTLIQKAREIGYQRVRLITLPSMRQAIGVYLGLGFQYIEPYRETTDPTARFMELTL
ncbi:MAG: GNAT family N-acetyltransferase [Firmicutes bacterium]|nr:GNAT family N-acetyltransferase [Bacillota bacterium]